MVEILTTDGIEDKVELITIVNVAAAASSWEILAGFKASWPAGAATNSAYALPWPGKLTMPNTSALTANRSTRDCTTSPEISHPRINGFSSFKRP